MWEKRWETAPVHGTVRSFGSVRRKIDRPPSPGARFARGTGGQPSQDARTFRRPASRRQRTKRAVWAKAGGEGGIRTHVPVTRQDAFEAPPLRPLRYLSVYYFGSGCFFAAIGQRSRARGRSRHQMLRALTGAACSRVLVINRISNRLLKKQPAKGKGSPLSFSPFQAAYFSQPANPDWPQRGRELAALRRTPESTSDTPLPTRRQLPASDD